MEKKIVLDDGFSFGLGCFETILVHGRGIFLKEHLERLNRGLCKLGIDKKIESSEIENYINTHGKKEKFAVKVMVSQENIAFSKREINYTKEVYNRGFKVGLSHVRRNETSPMTYIKSLCYGDNIIEKRRTKELCLDELIFLNMKGNITEGTVSNVFFIIDNNIVTPKVESGLLPGIVREKIIEAFQGEIQEREISLEELEESCEGVFLTNSLMGVMWVSELFGKLIEKHPLIVRAEKEYENMVLEEKNN